jgi:RND family efflux transporter MFP subunit
VWPLIASGSAAAQTTEVDGLTEAYRTVAVAASEPGLITKVFVREGDVVRQGQPLVALDSDVYAAMLAIAKQAMESLGNLQSAQADVQLKRDRLTKIEELRAGEWARQEELERSRTELAIAEARLVAVREELELRRLEHEKSKVQLERRTVRSPIDGVVTKRFKDEGEYAAPNDPTLFTVVQLDRLLAVFSVPSPAARELRIDQKVHVAFPGIATPAEGIVEFISPVTDAESGTVRVKVRIENPKQDYRSGERCSLEPAGAKRTKEPLVKTRTPPKR